MTTSDRRTSVVGKPVRALKTAELIAVQLRRQIVRGELKPGDALPPEVGLMQQFGVSRPTLREAFRILETESLLNVRRGSRGGARVIAPDLAVAARYVGLLLQIDGTTIEDVFEARVVTEPACAALLALARTEQDLADLRALTDDLEAGIAELSDPDGMSRSTYAFHALVMERCGNRALAIQGGVLQDIIATHISLALTIERDQALVRAEFRRLTKSYRRLIALLEARDAAGASRHWRLHLEGAAKAMQRSGITVVVDLFR
jgi:DNA-binding FadR family transcriptional regulator